MDNVNMFHVQEAVLLANGFTKMVVNERNGPDDVINTARFEYYTKKITDQLSISVNYTYLTLDEKEYTLHSSGVEMSIHDEWVELPISKLSDLLKLILILSGNG